MYELYYDDFPLVSYDSLRDIYNFANSLVKSRNKKYSWDTLYVKKLTKKRIFWRDKKVTMSWAEVNYLLDNHIVE